MRTAHSAKVCHCGSRASNCRCCCCSSSRQQRVDDLSGRRLGEYHAQLSRRCTPPGLPGLQLLRFGQFRLNVGKLLGKYAQFPMTVHRFGGHIVRSGNFDIPSR